MNMEKRIRDANRQIYNRLGDDYEMLDGRRSRALSGWLRKKLLHISGITEKREALLDIGCGEGFAARAAEGIFPKRYGMDISENILRGLLPQGILPVCADVVNLPLKPESIDLVVMFSVVHHFYDYKPVINEAYRVLRPGGLIYIDHDMNRSFFKRFRVLINIYRRFSSKEKAMGKMGVEKLYNLSEFHSEGIDSAQLKSDLVSLGFNIKESYCHWRGLSVFTDLLFGDRISAEDKAPLSCIIAEK
ncbi:MAG: class I SAM-dependent methyltransferase [Candidatus Omnitrophota bacterium]